MGKLIEVDEQEYNVLNNLKNHLESKEIDSKFIKELRDMTYSKCDKTEGRRYRHVITGYSMTVDKNIFFEGYLISLYNELSKR